MDHMQTRLLFHSPTVNMSKSASNQDRMDWDSLDTGYSDRSGRSKEVADDYSKSVSRCFVRS